VGRHPSKAISTPDDPTRPTQTLVRLTLVYLDTARRGLHGWRHKPLHLIDGLKYSTQKDQLAAPSQLRSKAGHSRPLVPLVPPPQGHPTPTRMGRGNNVLHSHESQR